MRETTQNIHCLKENVPLKTNNTRNNTIAPNDISMFLEEHPTFTRAQFATFFALSDKSAVRLINKMISEGIISASGEKRGVKYAKI